MYTELNRKYKNKIINKRNLLKKIGSFPRKKKVVMCHGVFAVVHPGHIRHLAFAKSKGDILVASLTSDKFVTKGRYRPHIPENLRALNLYQGRALIQSIYHLQMLITKKIIFYFQQGCYMKKELMNL